MVCRCGQGDNVEREAVFITYYTSYNGTHMVYRKERDNIL